MDQLIILMILIMPTKTHLMNYKNLIFALLALPLILLSCQDDDTPFGAVVAPTNLEATIDVADDLSGNVAVTPTAEYALTFHIYFKPDLDPVVIGPGETANFRYTDTGVYTQDIVIIAYGRGGAASSISRSIDLDVILMIDPVILQNLAGAPNQGKRWVWDSGTTGHFGVGDPAVDFANYFSATPNQLNPCMYDDVLIFSYDGMGDYRFQMEANEASFVNWAEIKRFFPNDNPGQYNDECRDLSPFVSFDTSFVVLDDSNGVSTLTVQNSFLSYWSGASSYEIVSLTEDQLVVRGLQDPFDPPGAQLAWYHTFVPEGGSGPVGCAGTTGNPGSGANDVLVWAEEFDVDGPPCSENWSYDLGTGNNGWGNEEVQYYTDDPSNIIVENGVLRITAKSEFFAGSNYTSARIKTNQNFDFTYGRVEARAKLPTGGGTWPAIWMLGSDYQTNTWPACGEIDIMEHVGNNQDEIFSSLHYPGNFGGNAVTQGINVPGVSDEFHIYAVEWTEDQITFSVDGNPYHTVAVTQLMPFDSDFFLIANAATGGQFGGNVDPNFDSSSLEIDYIRVYQ
ncbi:MAG TPA: laminarinase [Flavobacteriaceae bacterium]|nr:laminarinase [Flavobacteriaceae bacterium]